MMRNKGIEEKGIKCVSIGSGPAGRWLVVLEYENNFDVESTHDARDDALKRAKELAAERKVRAWLNDHEGHGAPVSGLGS